MRATRSSPCGIRTRASAVREGITPFTPAGIPDGGGIRLGQAES